MNTFYPELGLLYTVLLYLLFLGAAFIYLGKVVGGLEPAADDVPERLAEGEARAPGPRGAVRGVDLGGGPQHDGPGDVPDEQEDPDIGAEGPEPGGHVHGGSLGPLEVRKIRDGGEISGGSGRGGTLIS